MKDNKKELMNRLWTLAEQEIGCEAIAEIRLDELLHKYGILESELESEEVECEYFHAKNKDEYQSLIQIINKVTDGRMQYIPLGRYSDLCIGCDITAKERLEIEYLFDLSVKKLRKDKIAQLKAIICIFANHIKLSNESSTKRRLLTSLLTGYYNEARERILSGKI